MSQKKFDFECIYYTNELINQLIEEDFFLSSLVLPEKLRYIVLQLVQNNYTAINKLGLSQEQMTAAISKATKESFDTTLDGLVKDGLVQYNGIDNEGEYVVTLTENGKKSTKIPDEMVKTAKDIQKLHNGDTLSTLDTEKY